MKTWCYIEVQPVPPLIPPIYLHPQGEGDAERGAWKKAESEGIDTLRE